MLHEYALEPSLLNNWKDFRYFTEKFGVSHGRLISHYPKEWKKQVYSALYDCLPVERARIEEGLRRLDDRLMSRMSEWDPRQTWIQNAIQEDTKRPFHAILASLNPSHSKVLVGETLSDAEPLWTVCRQVQVVRSADAIAQCLAPLLAHAKQEIVLIDPHFLPTNPRHVNPLMKIAVAAQGRNLRLVYHAGDKQEASAFKTDCDNRLPSVLPAGVVLELFRGKQKEMHNRYVLTEFGGVMFGHGLDECDAIGPQHDVVTLLDAAIHKDIYDKHHTAHAGKPNARKPAFHFVIGTR